MKRACDPRLVSAARELRDRWLEQVNATPLLGQGKYDVSRRLNGTVVPAKGPFLKPEPTGRTAPALPAPAAV